jgi:hypothetical protein
MTQEELRMQMLAGIITEGQYKAKLNEVGEGTSQPFLYTTDDDYSYNFTTDKGTEYEVEIMSRYITHNILSKIPQDKALSMALVNFVADSNYGQSNIVNKGEMYRVMSTITQIIKDNISNNPEIGGVYFSPTEGKNPQNENLDLSGNQRYKLYQAYIQKSIPGAEIIHDDGEAFVFFKGWEDKLVEDDGYDED